MVRLGSPCLVAIGVALLLTLWIALVAAYYRSNGLGRAATRPPVTQIRAIADASRPRRRARGELLEAISRRS